MTPIELLEQRVLYLENLLAQFVKSDRYTFQRDIEISDGRKIQLSSVNGTRIGTAAKQKLSVFGVTPVIQAGAISAPSGGATVDAQARTAIGSLITAVKNFGITA